MIIIMKNNYILQHGTKLYRYDIIQPPSIWDISFRNPEYYNLGFEGLKKNAANFYYFFSNRETAINTGKKAIQKLNINHFWITETTIKTDMNLLNLTSCIDTVLMVLKLLDSNINILTNDYKLYNSGKTIPFSDFKEAIIYNMGVNRPFPPDIELIKSNTDLITSFFNAPGYPYSLLGQYLTDFSNGIIFKDDLKKEGYNGYIFDESIGGHTICLIDSNNIESPSSEKILC